jgi:hypothetical protein
LSYDWSPSWLSYVVLRSVKCIVMTSFASVIEKIGLKNCQNFLNVLLIFQLSKHLTVIKYRQHVRKYYWGITNRWPIHKNKHKSFFNNMSILVFGFFFVVIVVIAITASSLLCALQITINCVVLIWNLRSYNRPAAVHFHIKQH